MRSLLYIGRFQPYHLGHHRMLLEALDRSSDVVVGIGSVGAPTERNPFSFQARREMIQSSLYDANPTSVSFLALPDHPEDDIVWAQQVRDAMRGRDWALFGREKDATSFYLRLFPEVPLVLSDELMLPIDATAVRQLFFCRERDFMPAIRHLVPYGTYKVLERIRNQEKSHGLLDGHQSF